MRWSGGEWAPAEKSARTGPEPVRLLTWNVWFGGHMFDERRDALLAELGRRRPDVIALQEVTPELLGAITATPWIQDAYALSDADGSTIQGYGVLVMSRLPVRNVSLSELPSQMGRRLVTVELACGLTIASVHLESTADCAEERVTQLELIQPHLRALSDDVVLCGDMNFTPTDARETAALDPSFADTWASLRPTDPGYTVDTDINTMRYQVKSKRTRKRIDRIFLRSTRWRAQSIELVGTEPIDLDELDETFVSDHFGLAADLSRATAS